MRNPEPSSSRLPGNNLNRKFAGYSLAVGALLSIFMMLHHPSISAAEPAAQVLEMAQHAWINAMVHGTLIASILLFCGCLTIYSVFRGIGKLRILFALITYISGSLAMIGAALISGFIVPEIVSSFADASDAQLLSYQALRELCWYANQALANLGALCWLFAVLLWSLDLLNTPLPIKMLGAAVMMASTGTALALFTGVIRMDVAGMTIVTEVLVGWYLVAAYLLIGNRLDGND